MGICRRPAQSARRDPSTGDWEECLKQAPLGEDITTVSKPPVDPERASSHPVGGPTAPHRPKYNHPNLRPRPRAFPPPGSSAVPTVREAPLSRFCGTHGARGAQKVVGEPDQEAANSPVDRGNPVFSFPKASRGRKAKSQLSF